MFDSLIILCTFLVFYKLESDRAGNWFGVESLGKHDSETETSGLGLHCATLISYTDDLVP